MYIYFRQQCIYNEKHLNLTLTLNVDDTLLLIVLDFIYFLTVLHFVRLFSYYCCKCVNKSSVQFKTCAEIGSSYPCSQQ